MEDTKEKIQLREDGEREEVVVSTDSKNDANAFVMCSRSVGTQKPRIIEDNVSIFDATSLAASTLSGSTVPSSSQAFHARYRDSRYNIFDRLGSSFRRMSTSFGFEKNYRSLTIEDIDKGNTASLAIAALKLVNEKLFGGDGENRNNVDVEDLLSRHENLVFACLHCLIRAMSSPTNSTGHKCAIGKALGSLQNLSSLLSACKSNSEVMWRGMHCISLLSSESTNGDRLGDSGFCEIVTSFLVSFGQDEQSKSLSPSLSTTATISSNNNDEALVNCLKAIKFLCDSGKNQNRLRLLGLCDVMIKLFTQYTDSYYVLGELWGSRDSASSSSSSGNDQQNVTSTEIYVRLRHVCSVIEWITRVIYNLSYDNNSVKTSFHNLSACEKLLSSLHIVSKSRIIFAEDILKHEWGTRAISSLCQEHDDNKKAFADASGCQIIADLIVKVLGLLRNEIGDSLREIDFTTSNAAINRTLLSRNISDDSVDDSHNHSDEEKSGVSGKDFTGDASTTNTNSNSSNNYLSASSMATISTVTPLLESLLTLMADSSDPCETNQILYFESNVIPHVLEILSSVFSLCVASSKFKINSGKLLSITSTNHDSLQALCIEAALKAIRNLCHSHRPSLEMMFKCKAECVILVILRYFGVECTNVTITARQIHSISQWSLFALCALGSLSIEYRELLGNEGACNDISNVLLKQVSNPEVSQWACHTIGTLAQQSEENSIKFEESWVCRGIALTLQKHLTDPDVIEEACFAISSLCDAYDKNRISMMSVSIGEYIMTACKRYMDSI